LYIIQGLLIVGFGAGATALWIPRNKQGLWRRIMFVALGAAVTIVGIILLLAID